MREKIEGGEGYLSIKVSSRALRYKYVKVARLQTDVDETFQNQFDIDLSRRALDIMTFLTIITQTLRTKKIEFFLISRMSYASLILFCY